MPDNEERRAGASPAALETQIQPQRRQVTASRSPAQQPSSVDDFDWGEARESPFFIPLQQPTAVYLNCDSDLVIRQMGDYGDDDVFVVIAKDNVSRLLAAIRSTMGIEPAAPVPLLPKPSPPLTSAERSRRYRERHAQRDDVVTDRDGELFEQAAAE
jgi:hypothetical protein